MRNLTDHQVNPANDKLIVQVLDEPGQGGACHSYYVDGFDISTNPSAIEGKDYLYILFHICCPQK